MITVCADDSILFFCFVILGILKVVLQALMVSLGLIAL